MLDRPRGIPPDVTDGENLVHRVTIKMEIPINIPANFDQLPKEEQEKLMAQYRFMGIRLREDLKFQTVHLNRETLEL